MHRYNSSIAKQYKRQLIKVLKDDSFITVCTGDKINGG